MSHILHLDSSPRGSRSISRALTKEFVTCWLQRHPGERVTYRDVGQYPVPPVDEAWIAASFSKSEDSAPELIDALRISDELIDELLIAVAFGSREACSLCLWHSHGSLGLQISPLSMLKI
jgi:FMN-dependent NADH-azoreductase